MGPVRFCNLDVVISVSLGPCFLLLRPWAWMYSDYFKQLITPQSRWFRWSHNLHGVLCMRRYNVTPSLIGWVHSDVNNWGLSARLQYLQCVRYHSLALSQHNVISLGIFVVELIRAWFWLHAANMMQWHICGCWCPGGTENSHVNYLFVEGNALNALVVSVVAFSCLCWSTVYVDQLLAHLCIY